MPSYLHGQRVRLNDGQYAAPIQATRAGYGRATVIPDTVLTSPRATAPLAACAHQSKKISGAIPTDILHFPARVVATAADAPHRPRGVERHEGTADDHVHADHGPPAAPLRPPPSESRPTHRERDHRHGSRSPSLDGPWVARQGTEGRGEPGRDGPERAGPPPRSPGAPATREEAHRTPSARPCPPSMLGIRADPRASAQRTRQDQDAARRGSCPRVCAVAGGPAVPAIVAKSVPCLATAAARVCA